MAVDKPVKVPVKNITSTDIVSFNGGIDQRGDANADPNTFIASRNAMVDSAGLLTHRLALKKWLPDTVETVYEVFPAVYGTHLYYIIADDGKIKYCEVGATSWTDATGSNTVTTGEGIVTSFLRIQDKVLILNGQDKLGYVNLPTMAVVKFTTVASVTTPPTVAATVLLITPPQTQRVYYAVNYNSTVGQTAITTANIVTVQVNKARGTWKTDGTEYLTVTRAGTAPTGAVSWNMWVATASAGATIQPSDMLLLASGLPLDSTTLIDNGTLPIDISRGTAPEDNSTDGMIATYGREDKGRPILYGDPTAGKEHNLYIGGDGENALDFSPTNGGYVVELNKGTNYYPQGVIGFRNGQGIPSMTVLFSNTQGLSKQTIIEQQTITYGNSSFVVWAQTEQNYGAAGVSSPYSVVNYLGSLIFPTTDGIVSMDTEASMQNVLSSKRISDKFARTVKSIKNSALRKIVGTAWSNRIYMTVPSRGYDFNNEILIYDMTNSENPIWYSFDIQAQWIGTISPQSEAAFVYVCQDNHIFRLEEAYVALDENSDGSTSAFPVEATGALIGTNQAHNAFVSVIQVVFYLVDVIGEIQLGVTYRNENGRMKTKTKTVTQGEYASSAGGGWSSPGYLYSVGESTYNQWSDIPPIEDADIATKTTLRVRVPLNVITNEMQWFINTNLDNSSFILRSVSYEGVNIGVRGDLR
jgi:hypothetical protein